MQIKYVGVYDHIDNAAEERSFALSAAAKMEYVTGVLRRLGYDVLIVSPSHTLLPHAVPGHTKKVRPGLELKLFASGGRGGRVRRAVNYLRSRLRLFVYLVINTRRHEPVIVYHSLSLQFVVLLAKALRRFDLILEVEEIYQDVVPASFFTRWLEYRIFSVADGYIFSTELLNDALNPLRKPSVVGYGDYRLHQCSDAKPAAKTRVVYAGTLDPRKGGAAAAVVASAYLSDEFEIHILGGGTESDLMDIKALADESHCNGAATVTFHGTLRGSAYSTFLCGCQIGLSTQDPTSAFNASSFPSKILSYLGHGLDVVSVRTPAIEVSRVGEYLSFYDVQEPREIAEAIKGAALQGRGEGHEILAKLDREFSAQLASVVSSVGSK